MALKLVGALALASQANSLSAPEVLIQAKTLLKSHNVAVGEDDTLAEVLSSLKGMTTEMSTNHDTYNAQVEKGVSSIRSWKIGSSNTLKQANTVSNNWNKCVGEEQTAMSLTEQMSRDAIAAQTLEETRHKNMVDNSMFGDKLDFNDLSCSIDDCPKELEAYSGNVAEREAAIKAKVEAAVAKYTGLKKLSDDSIVASDSADKRMTNANSAFSTKKGACAVLAVSRLSAKCQFGEKLQGTCAALENYESTRQSAAAAHASQEQQWKSVSTMICLVEGLQKKDFQHTELARCQGAQDYYRDVGTLDQQEKVVAELKKDIRCGQVSETFQGGDWTLGNDDTGSAGYKWVSEAAADVFTTDAGEKPMATCA